MSIHTNRATKRSFAAVIAAALIASVLALVASPASAGTTVTLKRYSGIDRYATSALAATGAFTTGGNNVVLVSGENFADGLAASGLAGALGGPVLLTHQTTLLGSTANAIGAIDTGTASAATALTVTIVGGVNAVSAGVATSLTGLGYTVNRVSGADRYATAVAVGDKLRSIATVGSVVSKTTAILVSGTSFPDGLAAGGLAYLNKLPVLLTNGSSLDAGTTAFLNNEINPIAQVLIVGGTAAVAEAVATEVKAIANGLVAINVMRVSGADRYATALELAKFRAKAAVLQGNAETVTNIMLVSGESFADALSSAAKAGVAATMTILTTASAMDAASSTWIASKYSSVTNVFVTGGTSAVSTATATGAKTGATTVPVTATLNHGPGHKCWSITYSAIMTYVNGPAGTNAAVVDVDNSAAGAAIDTSYKMNNTQMLFDDANAASDDNVVCGGTTHDTPNATHIGSITCANNVVAGTTTCHFLSAAALAVGDVIKIGGATTPVSAVGSRSGTGSLTVAADLVAPTIAWDPIIVGDGHVTFTVSEAVTFGTADDVTTLSHDDVSCSGTDTSALTLVAGNTYMAVTAANVASGATCAVAAEYKDISGKSAALVFTSAAAVTDTTGPAVTAKLTKTVTTGAITAGMGTGGTYKVAAKATGAYGGPAGNAWSVQLIAGTATTLATVSLYDTVAKTIVVTACVATCTTGYQATAQSIVNAINAHAEISVNFTATVLAGANSTAVHNATSLAGGTRVYDLVLTANEIMLDVATATGFDDGEFTHDADGAGVGTAGCAVTQDAADLVATPNANDHYLKAMNITCTATAVNQLMTTGISHIVSSANTKDFAGNVIPAAGRKIIVSAG